MNDFCSIICIPGVSLTVGGSEEARLNVAPCSHVLGFLLDPHYVSRGEPGQLSVHQVVGERGDLHMQCMGETHRCFMSLIDI